MSADGNAKFDSLPHPLAMGEKSAPTRRVRQRVCAHCDRPLNGLPVLLKSGQSVHVDCYFLLQKKLTKDRPN